MPDCHQATCPANETLKTYADPERLLENALTIYACWKKREPELADAITRRMLDEGISLSEATG